MKRLPRMQESGLVVVILILGLFLWMTAKPVTVNPANPVMENGFLRLDNLFNSVFTVMSWMAIMAIGQTIVIITGGIDISVGSMMGLSAFVTALLLRNFGYDAPWWQVLPAGIGIPVGVGLLCGLINGSLVVGLRMHPFIVALATTSIFRWVSLKLGVTYGQSQPGNLKLPRAFTDGFIALPFKNVRMGGAVIEIYEFVPILIMLLVLAGGWIYLRHTVWGRETYAIGGNEEAARFSGIRVGWAKMRVYILCGLCAGIAGMLTCGKYKSAQTTTGDGYELNVIAAAVVGGASLTGGRGTALGAVLGMLVIQLIEDGIFVVGNLNLGFVNIPVVKEDTKLIMGFAILVAVCIDNLSTYLQSRRSARLRSAGH
jgi:ribose/xylose/arabinose/galactoside ABC-type transport system permease subunit